MRKIGWILIPTFVVAAVFSACGGGSKKTVDIPGGGKITTSDKLPSGFPDDFPIYDGAKVQGSLSGSSNGISGTTVTWETGDELSKVSDFYEKEFAKDAWKANSNGTVNDSSYWSGENSKGDKEMYVLVSAADGKTNIIATIGDKQDTSSGSSGNSLSSSNKTATAESEDSGSGDEPTTSSGPAKTPTPSALPDEVTLAKDFPKDRVPLPSGVRVTSNTSFGQGTDKTFIITYFTKDDPEKVTTYFSDEMPKHGWTDAFSSNTNGEYFVTFTGAANANGGNDGMTVSASPSTDTPGYTEVSLTVSITTTGG